MHKFAVNGNTANQTRLSSQRSRKVDEFTNHLKDVFTKFNTRSPHEIKKENDHVGIEENTLTPFRNKSLMRMRELRIKKEAGEENPMKELKDNQVERESDDEEEEDLRLDHTRKKKTGKEPAVAAYDTKKMNTVLTNVKTGSASVNGFWDPVAASRKYLYDFEAGIAFPPDRIKENLAKVFKKKMPISVDSWLELASKASKTNPILEAVCLASSWNTAVFNYQMQQLPRAKAEETKEVAEVFYTIDEGLASTNQRSIRLPSGYEVFIPSLLAPDVLSSLVSNDLDHIVRTISNAIMARVFASDPFAPAYCVARTNSARYLRITPDFVHYLTDYICNGLKINPDESEKKRLQKIRVFNLARQTLTNYIERHRKMFNKTRGRNASKKLKKKLVSLQSSSKNEDEPMTEIHEETEEQREELEYESGGDSDDDSSESSDEDSDEYIDDFFDKEAAKTTSEVVEENINEEVEQKIEMETEGRVDERLNIKYKEFIEERQQAGVRQEKIGRGNRRSMKRNGNIQKGQNIAKKSTTRTHFKNAN